MPFRMPAQQFPREVCSNDIPVLVEGLRKWIGADRLNSQLKAYLSRRESDSGINIVRLLERQAVLSGFEDYRKQTLDRQRPVRNVTEQISMLTNVAGLRRPPGFE